MLAQRSQALVDMVPGLSESSRVVISGCSSSAAPLVTALQHRGVQDILLVDTVQEDSAALQSTFTSQRLGNALGVQTWGGVGFCAYSVEQGGGAQLT